MALSTNAVVTGLAPIFPTKMGLINGQMEPGAPLRLHLLVFPFDSCALFNICFFICINLLLQFSSYGLFFCHPSRWHAPHIPQFHRFMGRALLCTVNGSVWVGGVPPRQHVWGLGTRWAPLRVASCTAWVAGGLAVRAAVLLHGESMFCVLSFIPQIGECKR